MDNIGNIAGVAPLTTVIPGASTPAPYNAPLAGLTDGNNLAGASKNMAAIYNMFNHEIVSVIKAAGLTPDINNWAQLAQAIQIIAAGGSNALSNHLTNAITDHPMFSVRAERIGLIEIAPYGAIPSYGLPANGSSFSAATYPLLATKYPSLVLPNMIDGDTTVQAISGFNTRTVGENLAHDHSISGVVATNGGNAGTVSANFSYTTVQTGSSGGAANKAAGLKVVHFVIAR
jgi:hypothetical protein